MMFAYPVRNSFGGVSHPPGRYPRRRNPFVWGALVPMRIPSLPARQIDPGGPFLGLVQASASPM
jgi:hypothetical protein